MMMMMMIPDSQTSSIFFEVLEPGPPFPLTWSKAEIGFIGCVSRVPQPQGKNSESLDRMTLLYAHTHTCNTFGNIRRRQKFSLLGVFKSVCYGNFAWLQLYRSHSCTSSRFSGGEKLALANANLFSLLSKAMLCFPSDDNCDTQPRKLCQAPVSPNFPARSLPPPLHLIDRPISQHKFAEYMLRETVFSLNSRLPSHLPPNTTNRTSESEAASTAT